MIIGTTTGGAKFHFAEVERKSFRKALARARKAGLFKRISLAEFAELSKKILQENHNENY